MLGRNRYAAQQTGQLIISEITSSPFLTQKVAKVAGMKKQLRIPAILYLATGVIIYLAIKIFAGGLGIVSIGGPIGEILEMTITILAWPLVILLSVAVVLQGR